MSNYILGKNPYQGTAKKALFVCTGGILRSATAAHYAHKNLGWNTRSCGILQEAIPPVHPNLLEWADEIYCLEGHHQQFINHAFGDAYNSKIKVLNIEDSHEYGSKELLRLLSERLK